MNQVADRLHSDQTASPPVQLRRWQRLLGWALCGGASLVVFLLSMIPLQPGPAAAAIGVAAILVTLFAIVLTVSGAGLLMWGYLELFRTAWGTVLWIGILIASLLVSAILPANSSAPLTSGVLTLAAVWGLVASLAIGPALTIYLIRTDRSVRVFAITYLLVFGALFSVGQSIGWDTFLLRLVGGVSGESLWLLQGLLCVAIWVTLICPVAFIWHTIVLARGEMQGVAAGPNGSTTAN